MNDEENFNTEVGEEERDDYDLEDIHCAGYTSYSAAVHWLHNNLIMCNDIPKVDENLFEMTKGYDWEADREIFQYFLTDMSDSEVDWMVSHFSGLHFAYSELLGLWVLLVDHWGTGWEYVSVCVYDEDLMRNIRAKGLEYA